MNQEEKCWKEVVREENKRRLFFFFPLVHQNFIGTVILQDHMGPVLLQVQLCFREHRPCGQYPVLRSLEVLILLRVPQMASEPVRGRLSSRVPTHDGFRQKRLHICLHILLIPRRLYQHLHAPKQLQRGQENTSQSTLGPFSCDLPVFH